MNKQQEWMVYTLSSVNLLAVSTLGKDIAGGGWDVLFWAASVASVFAWVFTMALMRDYEPIAKYAYDATEELEHE